MEPINNKRVKLDELSSSDSELTKNGVPLRAAVEFVFAQGGVAKNYENSIVPHRVNEFIAFSDFSSFGMHSRLPNAFRRYRDHFALPEYFYPWGWAFSIPDVECMQWVEKNHPSRVPKNCKGYYDLSHQDHRRPAGRDS